MIKLIKLITIYSIALLALTGCFKELGAAIDAAVPHTNVYGAGAAKGAEVFQTRLTINLFQKDSHAPIYGAWYLYRKNAEGELSKVASSMSYKNQSRNHKVEVSSGPYYVKAQNMNGVLRAEGDVVVQPGRLNKFNFFLQ